MIAHDLNCLVARAVARGNPTGKLAVPDERVAANLHTIRFGKIHQRIGVVKVVCVLRRMSSVKLESVLSDNNVEFLFESVGVWKFVSKRRHVDRGPYVEAHALSVGSKRHVTQGISAVPRQIRRGGDLPWPQTGWKHQRCQHCARNRQHSNSPENAARRAQL